MGLAVERELSAAAVAKWVEVFGGKYLRGGKDEYWCFGYELERLVLESQPTWDWIDFENVINDLIDVGFAQWNDYGSHPGVISFDTDSDLYEVGVVRPNTAFAGADKFGFTWVEEALRRAGVNANSSEQSTSDSRSDDGWAPLPLDRNGENYADAVEAAEVAVQEVRQSNGYASAEPVERDQIVATTEVGLQNLKGQYADRGIVISLLIRPLRYLSKKFADASIGSLAKAAVDALVKLLAS